MAFLSTPDSDVSDGLTNSGASSSVHSCLSLRNKEWRSTDYVAIAVVSPFINKNIIKKEDVAASA